MSQDQQRAAIEDEARDVYEAFRSAGGADVPDFVAGYLAGHAAATDQTDAGCTCPCRGECMT